MNEPDVHIDMIFPQAVEYRLVLIYAIYRMAVIGPKLPKPTRTFTGKSDTVETFTDVPEFLETKTGDCVGATCYVAAWLTQQGIFAVPIIVRKKTGEVHAVAWLGNGKALECTWIYQNLPDNREIYTINEADLSEQIGYIRKVYQCCI